MPYFRYTEGRFRYAWRCNSVYLSAGRPYVAFGRTPGVTGSLGRTEPAPGYAVVLDEAAPPIGKA